MIAESINTGLQELEIQAENHLQAFKKHYWSFVEAIQAIRLSGYWQADNLTWEQYLQARWLPLLELKSTARIRQLEAAYPMMNFVRDVTGVTLNENQIRCLKSIVAKEDIHLMPEIVSIVFEYTSTPNNRHYQAVYEVVLERNRHGSLSLDGQALDLDMTKLAAVEAMIEADKRYREHQASGKWKSINRYEITDESTVKVTGVTLQPNQRVIVIVQELKEDSANEKTIHQI